MLIQTLKPDQALHVGEGTMIRLLRRTGRLITLIVTLAEDDELELDEDIRITVARAPGERAKIGIATKERVRIDKTGDMPLPLAPGLGFVPTRLSPPAL